MTLMPWRNYNAKSQLLSIYNSIFLILFTLTIPVMRRPPGTVPGDYAASIIRVKNRADNRTVDRAYC